MEAYRSTRREPGSGNSRGKTLRLHDSLRRHRGRSPGEPAESDLSGPGGALFPTLLAFPTPSR